MLASGKPWDVPSAWSQEAELAAYRGIQDPDASRVHAALPELFDVCKMLGNTESVNWLWILVPLATVAPQLSPRDVLVFCPSVEVLGTLWACLLHPGSCNSSGSLTMLNKSMELLYDRLYSEECCEAKTKHEAECKR